MSYDEFYEENWETVMRYVAALTGEREWAKDITQNAFVKLLAKWEQIKSPMAYLYETARSEISNHYRQNKEIPYSPSDPIFDQAVIEDYDKWQPLHDAIALLTPHQQDIVRLYFFEQLTQQEIAEQLGCRQQSVQECIGRAKDKLRELLTNEKDL